MVDDSGDSFNEILEHQSQLFGCCTADSQADEDQNQLKNNLKIDFGATQSGDSY